MQPIKIIIEQHEDGFVGYLLGFKAGAIVGQGGTYDDALTDTRSAIAFYIEHYGVERFSGGFEYERPLIKAFLTEITIENIISESKPINKRPFGLAEGYFIGEKAFATSTVVLNDD